MRALTLLVRNLDASAKNPAQVRCSALESFLSRCTVTASREVTAVDWACAIHGIQRFADWPVGAILARAGSIRPDAPHSADDAPTYWICAQPVHLAVDRDSLILQPPAQLRLSDAESHELFDALKEHFAQEHLSMKHAATGIWCLGTPGKQELSTTEPLLVQGRNVDGLLPQGADARRWQRLVTEAQMILHDHRVNAAREQRGEAPVNSLWIWGGGVLPAVERRFDAIYAADPFLRALARLSGGQVVDVPASPMALPDAEDILVEFELQPGDAGACSLPALEAHWLSPAWDGLASGQLDEVTLVLPLTHALAISRCGRQERRRFWKRRRALPDLLARISETSVP